MEGSVDSQGGHIFCEIEGVRHVGSIQDEIEGECPGLSPIFVFSTNELFSAKCERVFLFVRTMRDCIGFSTEGRGPEESKMTKATTDNGVNRRPAEE